MVSVVVMVKLVGVIVSGVNGGDWRMYGGWWCICGSCQWCYLWWWKWLIVVTIMMVVDDSNNGSGDWRMYGDNDNDTSYDREVCWL